MTKSQDAAAAVFQRDLGGHHGTGRGAFDGMRDSRFRHGAVIVPDLAFYSVIAASVEGVPGEIIVRPVGIAAAVAEIPADVEGVVDAGVGGIGGKDLRNVDHSR